MIMRLAFRCQPVKSILVGDERADRWQSPLPPARLNDRRPPRLDPLRLATDLMWARDLLLRSYTGSRRATVRFRWCVLISKTTQGSQRIPGGGREIPLRGAHSEYSAGSAALISASLPARSQSRPRDTASRIPSDNHVARSTHIAYLAGRSSSNDSGEFVSKPKLSGSRGSRKVARCASRVCRSGA